MRPVEFLTGRTVAISISESPLDDLRARGAGLEHLRYAMREVARQLLANGATLAYGGDLRPGGFTEDLFDMASRYGRPDGEGNVQRILNYLSMPEHLQIEERVLEERRGSIAPYGRLILLSEEGGDWSEKRHGVVRISDQGAWSRALSAMRKRMSRDSDARFCLGGRIEGYKGRYPGVAEEIAATIHANKALLLAGGFGGCSLDAAQVLGFIEPRRRRESVSDTGYREVMAEIRKIRDEVVYNGLTTDERSRLAETGDVDEMVVLLLGGLYRLFGGPR